jgi:catechol 2,3-dioxygenase-like lactoylglutathione lyase family enzyme
MLTKTVISNVYVLDQEEALDFYVGKLGFELRNDIDMGFMRWLTVGLPGDEHELLLSLPASPGFDETTSEQLRDLITKGAGGGTFFYTDDAQQTYEDLKAKGVEFTDEPTDRFYGIDMGLRDPFGNHMRITEPKEFTPEQAEKAASGERFE